MKKDNGKLNVLVFGKKKKQSWFYMKISKYKKNQSRNYFVKQKIYVVQNSLNV